jgi:glycosyltransferase involved in cell wall biosynthesis
VKGSSALVTSSLPRISIVTPSYNQGPYIRRTIESVLSQGYPDLEYLVVDGGSTDETLGILREYERHLSWTSEPDRGQSDALNKGFLRATGEVLAFLNSDDQYEPDALLRVGEFFASHPEAAWLTGRCRIIDDREQEIRPAITLYKNFWLRLHSYRVLQVINYVSQPATFWRREVAEFAGPFDESLHYAMDYDFWLRAGRRHRLWFLEHYLAAFRVYPASKSGSSADVPFEVTLNVARRYVRSPLVLTLHRVHASLATAIYRRMMAA